MFVRYIILWCFYIRQGCYVYARGDPVVPSTNTVCCGPRSFADARLSTYNTLFRRHSAMTVCGFITASNQQCTLQPRSWLFFFLLQEWANKTLSTIPLLLPRSGFRNSVTKYVQFRNRSNCTNFATNKIKTVC